LAEPTACIISLGTRKIPLPIIVPTTIAIAWRSPNARGSCAGSVLAAAVISGMLPLCGGSCENAHAISDDERHNCADGYQPGVSVAESCPASELPGSQP